MVLMFSNKIPKSRIMKSLTFLALFFSFLMGACKPQKQVLSAENACAGLPKTLYNGKTYLNHYAPYQAEGNLNGTLPAVIERIESAKIDGLGNIFLDRTLIKGDYGSSGFLVDTTLAISSYSARLGEEKTERGTLYASVKIAKAGRKARIVIHDVYFIYTLTGAKITLENIAMETDPLAIFAIEPDWQETQQSDAERKNYLCRQAKRIHSKTGEAASGPGKPYLPSPVRKNFSAKPGK